jgi:hypothetical protein
MKCFHKTLRNKEQQARIIFEACRPLLTRTQYPRPKPMTKFYILFLELKFSQLACFWFRAMNTNKEPRHGKAILFPKQIDFDGNQNPLHLLKSFYPPIKGFEIICFCFRFQKLSSVLHKLVFFIFWENQSSNGDRIQKWKSFEFVLFWIWFRNCLVLLYVFLLPLTLVAALEESG